ncbi:MAG: lipopolysaccharide biosynthesis protein [Verrucomicrobia bacterium]|nr:lipopolysaccharide biosynthesis protein [Verrucomicrobiota bacterium]
MNGLQETDCSPPEHQDGIKASPASVFSHPIVRALLWAGAGGRGGQFLSLLALLVLARLLGPAAFGILAMIDIVIGICMHCSDLGFSRALIQRPGLRRDHLNTAFCTGLGLGGACSLVLVLLAGPMARLAAMPELTAILSVLALRPLLASIGRTHAARLRRDLHFAPLAAAGLLGALVSGIGAVVLALLEAGLWSLVFLRVAETAVSSFVTVVASKWIPSLHISKIAFHELLRFGRHIVGLRLLQFGEARADNLLIGLLAGPTALGYYVFARRIVSTFAETTFTGCISTVAFPAFSEAVRRGTGLTKIVARAVLLNLSVGLPVLVLFAVLAPALVTRLFGATWEPAVPIIWLLCIYHLSEIVTSLTGSLLQATGRPAWEMRLKTATCMLALVAYALCAPLGIVAVAAGKAILAYLILPVHVYLIRKVTRLHPNGAS